MHCRCHKFILSIKVSATQCSRPAVILVRKKSVQITALTLPVPWAPRVEENFLTRACWREGGMWWWSNMSGTLRSAFLGRMVVTSGPAWMNLLRHSGTSLRVPCNEVTRGKKQRQECKQAGNLCPLKGKTQEQRNWQMRQLCRGKWPLISYTNQCDVACVKTCLVFSEQTVGKT